MRLLRIVVISLLTFLLVSSAHAQPKTVATDLHEGTFFEVAFGVLWPAVVEKGLADTFQLCIISRSATVATVEYGPITKRVKVKYNIAPNVARFVEVPSGAVKPSLEGGTATLGVTVRATAAITVTTFVEHGGNRNATLHFPVPMWGRSYRTFNYAQDRWGTAANEKIRPGQIVITAAQDSTVVTFTSPASISAKGLAKGLPPQDTVTANKPVTVLLQAHETLTLLAKILPDYVSEVYSDLTGTHITSTKPIAVLSGHTKAEVGYYWGALPTQGLFATESYFVRNGYYQSLLPDDLADTAFVTIPLVYTGGREEEPDTFDPTPRGDQIRILATQDKTVVRRTRGGDSTGLVWVDTLQAGEYYIERAAEIPYKWFTSKPSHVMQYGKSWYSKHQVERFCQPTMIVVPGVTRWIREASFSSPNTIDDFLSVVVRTADTASVLLNGAPLTDSVGFRPVNGTGLSYIRKTLDSGTYTLQSTSSDIVFMAWSYGSLDGLWQNGFKASGAYGKPVGVNLSRPCTDTITTRNERTVDRYVVIAKVSSTNSCSAFTIHEVVTATNAVADSVVMQNDSIVYYISRISPDSVGKITLRFVTTSGTMLDRTINLDMGTVTQYHIDLTYAVLPATKNRNCEATISTQTPIPTHLTHCLVTMSYDANRLQPEESFEHDTTVAGLRTTTFRFAINEHAAGKVIGFLEFSAKSTPITIHTPSIDTVVWYQDSILRSNVRTTVNTLVLGVDDEAHVNARTRDMLSLEVSPQPANDYVSITYSTGPQGGSLRGQNFSGSLRLFDYAGALVMDLSDKLTGEEGSIVVNTQALSSGMYVLQLSNGTRSDVKPLIVE